MKYKLVIAQNTSDYYMVALREIAQTEHFKDTNTLLEELSSKSPHVTLASLEQFFRSGGTIAFAMHKNHIVAMATLVTVTKINSVTGRIEHVVVDPAHRRNNLSRQLMEQLIAIAKKKKLRYLDLTTEPKRVAANELYRSLGFEKRETNPYRLML